MNISDISGKPMVMLGGPFVHKQYVKGDICVEFKWHDGEPCMILYKAAATSKFGAYMVEMKDAYQFANPNGHQTAQLQDLCRGAHDAMGFHQDKYAVFRIMDIILDGLGELLRMPPEPKASEDQNRPVAEGDELKIVVDGKTLFEVTV
jgi:hypothetical protein